MRAPLNDDDELTEVLITSNQLASISLGDGWQKSDFMFGEEKKNVKAAYTCKVAYEAVLNHLPGTQGTQRVNLSHAYENGELKKSIINIRKYTAAGRATTDGMFFDAEEIPFLHEHLPQAATSRYEYRQKQEYSGDRTVSVSNRRVRELDYVPPTEGDVIDGYKHKTVVVVGSRKNEYYLARELDLYVVDRLMEELININFILSHKNMLATVIYDHFFGVLLLKLIEPDVTRWGLVEQTLLADDEKLHQLVEDAFDYIGFELRLQTSRNCKAFALEPTIMADRFNSKYARQALYDCLALRLYADTFTVDLFCKIGQKM